MAATRRRDDSRSRTNYKGLDDDANSIRLLRILAKASDNTFCKLPESDWVLIEVPLATAPAYVALSYVWGGPSDRVWLTAADMDYWIPQALREALRSVAHRLAEGDSTIPQVQYVWADAISIDQSNEGEKTKQVANMFHIYGNAVAAVAWLGSPVEGVEEIFAGLTNLAETMNTRRGAQTTTSERTGIAGAGEGAHKALGGFLASHHSSTALEAILHHPLWSRIWILQETVAPKEIFYMCGCRISSVLRSSLLFDLLETEYRLKSHEPYNDNKDQLVASRWISLRRYARRMLQERAAAQQGDRRSLAALLRKTWSLFNATDPRDLVYALLSISSDRPFSPDYGHDYPEVRVRTAVYLTQKIGLWRTLREAERSGAWSQCSYNVGSESSWAPDWSVSPHCSTADLNRHVGKFDAVHPTWAGTVRPNSWPYSLEAPFDARHVSLKQNNAMINASPPVWTNMLGQVQWPHILRYNLDARRFCLKQNKAMLFVLELSHTSLDHVGYKPEDQIVAVEDSFTKLSFALIRPDGDGHFWLLHVVRLVDTHTSKPPGPICLVCHLCSPSFICEDNVCAAEEIVKSNWQAVRFR